jgi:hypothetical protein
MDGQHSSLVPDHRKTDDIVLSFRSANAGSVADELLLSSTPGGEWQHFKRGALRPSDVVYSGHRGDQFTASGFVAPRNCLRPEATLEEA